MVHNRYSLHTLLIIFIIGVIAITPQASEAHMDIDKLVQSTDINLSVKHIYEEEPVRVIIPSRGINIDVVYSPVENGTWFVPEVSAGFAEGSSFLDEEHGNSIIFAHARNGLFRELLGIQKEDEIVVMGTENLYKYKVISIEKILPDEIDKIRALGDNHLTLFTCEGWNDEYRLLVKAVRIDTHSMVISSHII